MLMGVYSQILTTSRTLIEMQRLTGPVAKKMERIWHDGVYCQQNAANVEKSHGNDTPIK